MADSQSYPLPLFELVSKYRLPFITKAASTCVCDSGSGKIIVGNQYRLHCLLTVKMVDVTVLDRKPSTTSTERYSICIPENYQGRFQILPDFADLDDREPTQSKPMTIREIIKMMPTFIKVLEFEPTKVTKRHNLWAGNVLEVLGTTERCTKQGIQSLLRVKKKHNEFVLEPDFCGRFQPCENQTLTIAEILQKFPLPQRVLMIPSENHSQSLLDMLSPSDLGYSRTFLLRRRHNVEFVIGVDNGGFNAVVIDIDLMKVNFYPPIDTKKSHSMISKQRGLMIDDLNLDQVICKTGTKLIICKPWGEVFKIPPPVLNVKRPSTKKKVRRAESGDSSDSDGYDRIPFFGDLEDDIEGETEYSSGSDGYDRIPVGAGRDRLNQDDNAEEGSETEYCPSSGSDGYDRIPSDFRRDSLHKGDDTEEHSESESCESDGYDRNPFGANSDSLHELAENCESSDGYLRRNVPSENDDGYLRPKVSSENDDGYLRPNVPSEIDDGCLKPNVSTGKNTSAHSQSRSNYLSLPTTKELKELSEDEVVDVLEALNFSHVIQQKFKESNVDGSLFSVLDYEILKTDFGLSEFHARKLVKFINGWRPIIGNKNLSS